MDDISYHFNQNKKDLIEQDEESQEDTNSRKGEEELEENDEEQDEESIEENKDLIIKEKKWIKGNISKLDKPFLMNKTPILNSIIKPEISNNLANKIKKPEDIIPTFIFREIITNKLFQKICK